MIILYRLLELIANIAYFPILVVLYYAFQAIKGLFNKNHWTFSEWIEEVGKEIYSFAGKLTKNLIIVSLIALLLTNPVIHQLVGINNLKINPAGTYCFYVEAKKNGAKTYTLPAQIRIEEIGKEEHEKERIYRYYYIEKVFFSNGGWLDTSDLDSVELNDAVYFYDDNEDEWKLTLLNKHAYTPEVKETNNASWFEIALLSIEISSIIIVLYALSKGKGSTDEWK